MAPKAGPRPVIESTCAFCGIAVTTKGDVHGQHDRLRCAEAHAWTTVEERAARAARRF